MLRERLISRSADKPNEFKWRSREVSRLEGLSDTVFGFAITLLIVSLEVPRTSGELLETMRGFVPFVFTFGVLYSLWHKQFIFFRRFGIEDTPTVILNGALLLFVLFFVFPFKFLIGVVVNRLTGSSKTILLADGRIEPVIRVEHWPKIFAIYGFGLAAIFLVFALLYRHAYDLRDELELNPVERFDTRETMRLYLCNAALGVIVGLNGLVTGFRTTTRTDNVLAIVFGVIELGAIVVVMRFRTGKRKRRAAFISQSTSALSPQELPLHAS
jgi:uncharacterized membrane protein